MAKIAGELFVGANKRGDRTKYDFYPTPEPERVITALESVWNLNFSTLWEPACGNGALAEVLIQRGFDVLATDLCDHGYGLPDTDFFECGAQPGYVAIITNPPWDIARKWIEHAKAIGIQRMALLLPTTFYSSVAGLKSFDHWQPKIIAPLTWRLDFRGQGSPVQTSQWVVWDNTIKIQLTEYILLEKPT